MTQDTMRTAGMLALFIDEAMKDFNDNFYDLWNTLYVDGPPLEEDACVYLMEKIIAVRKFSHNITLDCDLWLRKLNAQFDAIQASKKQ